MAMGAPRGSFQFIFLLHLQDAVVFDEDQGLVFVRAGGGLGVPALDGPLAALLDR
jgi:hypothetical protein